MAPEFGYGREPDPASISALRQSSSQPSLPSLPESAGLSRFSEGLLVLVQRFQTLCPLPQYPPTSHTRMKMASCTMRCWGHPVWTGSQLCSSSCSRAMSMTSSLIAYTYHHASSGKRQAYYQRRRPRCVCRRTSPTHVAPRKGGRKILAIDLFLMDA